MTNGPARDAPLQPSVAVQIGPLRLQGPGAIVVSLILLGLIALLVVWSRPSPRMILAGTLWVAFLIYWAAAAKGAAPAVRSESAASRSVHTLLLNLAQLLLFIPVPGLRARFIPLSPWIWGSGLAVQALGFLLAVRSRQHLGRNWSGAVTAVRDHELVRSGPYRFVRHPIYMAMFLMSAGIGLVSGQLHALIGLAVLAVAYARKIPQEERNLREIFGAAYDDYRRETKALIPGVL